MIEPYGILAALLGALMMAISIREYLRDKLSTGSFLAWMAIWAAIFLTGLFPRLYSWVVAALGMATPIHFVTTFSIILLFAIVYQLNKKLDEVNFKLNSMAQELALRDLDRDRSGDRSA
ncbi:MAG: DUF2304 domain-containing protein [Candidatus Bathyarchaeia archaeon]